MRYLFNLTKKLSCHRESTRVSILFRNVVTNKKATKCCQSVTSRMYTLSLYSFY